MIKHVDVLELTNPVFRKLYRDGYFHLVKRAPHLVDKLYDMLNHPHQSGMAQTARLTLERANFTRLTRLLRQKWDLVINTHFLPPELISHLHRINQVQFPQVTVVTDFDVQGLWIHRPCEAYFVATPEARAYMASLGINPDRVHVTGIPIDPVFTQRKDRDACRRKHGFFCDRPLILQMAGRVGIGSVEQIYRSLRAVDLPIQICTVTGKNADVKHRLAAIQPNRFCRVIGFTCEVDELMAAADILVTKPGGLTSSEALARGCPMLIVEPFPGQEERNSDFLLENGCAIKANNLKTLGHKLKTLLSDPARLQQMRDAAICCSRPSAARDVAEHCARLLESGVGPPAGLLCRSA